MTVEHLQTDTLYPVADQAHLPRRWPAYRTRAVWTGERRAPKAGDWFLSGAVSEGTHYGAVIHQQRSGLDRRSTLAHLIRSRARDVKRQAAEETRACETVVK